MNIVAFVYLFVAFFITRSSMKPWRDSDMGSVERDSQGTLNNDLDVNERKEHVNRNHLASTEIIWSSDGSHNEYNGNIRKNKSGR